MDFNSPPDNLDPKLKEAYDRIMGNLNGQNPAPQNQSVNQGPLYKTEVVEKFPQQQDIISSPIFNNGNYVNSEVNTPGISNADSPFITAGKRNLIPAPVLLLGTIIFFIIYAVTWSKVFGLF